MKQGSNNEGTSTKYLSLVIIVIIVIKCLQEVIINVTSLARAFVISFLFLPRSCPTSCFNSILSVVVYYKASNRTPYLYNSLLMWHVTRCCEQLQA